MGLITNILQRLGTGDPTIPVAGKIYVISTVERQIGLRYDYVTIESLARDERVYSILALVASMVEKAFVGIEIRPENRYTDDKLEEKEKKAINAGDKFCRTLKIRRKFFEYAWQMVSHGDLFEEIELDGNKGIVGLSSLPLNSVQVFEHARQIKATGVQPQILKENLIIVKKSENDINPRTIRLGDYIHFSFKNHGVWRKDIKGINTYNIYSIPPIATLQKLVDWKEKTIENDSIWKNKLLPRIKHVLKMPSIVPSKYPGTASEKIAAAKKDADMLTDGFIKSTKTLRPDDDLVESDAVDTTILEPSSTNYQQPNENINQINNMLNGPQGLPGGALGSASGASVGMELSGIFAGIRIENLVNNLADGFTELLKRHLNIAETGLGEELIDRMYIHTDSALTVERFEKMKTAISMVSTGVYTKSEIRRSTGHARLPQLTEDQFPDKDMISAGKTTLKDMTGDVKKEGTDSENNNNSPQGERNTSVDSRVK